MKRIFIPATSAEDWRRFLASPERHWRTGYSARALAYCWQAADGFPPEIIHLFAASGIPALHHVELLFAFPEYKVALPGGQAASQSDIFVIGKAADQRLITITVEGKVAESFDQTVAEWSAEPSSGKRQRLGFIRQQLGLAHEVPGHIRYQLLHRTVAAVIEATRLNAAHALLLIHSFSQTDRWFEDYRAFTALFGVQPVPNRLVVLTQQPQVTIYAGWARGNPAYLTS